VKLSRALEIWQTTGAAAALTQISASSDIPRVESAIMVELKVVVGRNP
jgi:hypothetical protein